MLKWIKRSVLLLCAVLIISTMGIAAYAQETAPAAPLWNLLSLIPAASLDEIYVSYVDYAALISHRPEAVMPQNIADWETLKDKPAGRAILAAYMGVNAGPTDILQSWLQYDLMQQTSGLDIFNIYQGIEVGKPPMQQQWLAGKFDLAVIDAALKARGYTLQASTSDSPYKFWCGSKGCEGGTIVDLKNRQAAFPFGGKLGQQWPIIATETILASTRDERALRAAIQQAKPTLAEVPEVADLIEAFTSSFKAQDKASLAQLYLVTPQTAGLDVLTIPSNMTPAQREQIRKAFTSGETASLPVYSLFGLAHVYTADAQWVFVGLAFTNEADAQAAGERIEQRLQNVVSLRINQPVLDLIKERNGTVEPYQVVHAKQGNYILIMPFRFPAESAELVDNRPFQSALPYRLFVNMLISRDLAWLTINTNQ